MTRAMIRRRIRALSTDERGFTLIETIIAVTIIFGSLLALAYTATIGFGYEDLARQKQTATGIADQIMEETRGLPWDKIVAGHLASELEAESVDTDTNLAPPCPGDAPGVKRFLSCSAGTTPGSGEKLVALASACPVVVPANPDCVAPLVRHTGQIVQNNITYTWRTYDTNSCPTAITTGCTASKPYRVTVRVTWTGGKAGPNKVVQVQSLFWSPAGCRSTATHPFAAPCQAFFNGVATSPHGNINLAQGSDPLGTPAVNGTTLITGDLYTSSVESSVQQEQLTYTDGTFTESEVRIEDGSSVQTAGGQVAWGSAADTDPGTGSATPSSVMCPDPTHPCTGGSVSSGSGTTITLTAPRTETGRSVSTTAAAFANACPPYTAPQIDSKPCSGSRVQQGGTLSAILTTSAFGSLTLARILQAASPDTTFVDRVLWGQTPAGLCAPTSTSEGCLEETATRYIGTVNVGELPTGLTPPTGWAGGNAWNGYYFSIVGYNDRVTAAAGTNGAAAPPVPVPTVTTALGSGTGPAGTVYCWNGSGYAPVLASSATAVACTPLAWTGLVDGNDVDVTLSATTGPSVITKSPTSASGLTLTDVTAQVTPPTATIQYWISVNGASVANLAITINLDTLEARGSYAVAPTSGT